MSADGALASATYATGGRGSKTGPASERLSEQDVTIPNRRAAADAAHALVTVFKPYA